MIPVLHIGSGPTYVGARTNEIKEKNARIRDLQQEVKKLMARIDQLETRYSLKSGYSGLRKGGPGPIPATEKRKW